MVANTIEEGRELMLKRERNSNGHLKHIVCNGARFHVISWYGGTESCGRKCSEPECEINFEPVILDEG